MEEILEFLEIDNQISNFEGKKYNEYVVERPRGKISQYFLQNKTANKLARKVIPNKGRRLFGKKILLTKDTTKPEMNKNEKEFLIDFYSDDVKKLKVLLGRNLPWPNFEK